jgi:hypothetical protein
LQYTPNTPKKSLQDLELYTPIGTEGVRADGAHVLGRWQPKLTTFAGFKNRLLVEDFVNWSGTTDEIVHFTRNYGPLNCEAVEGKEFQFSIEGWRASQQQLRQMWEARSGRIAPSTTLGGELPYQLTFRGRTLIFSANTVEAYLRLELFTATAERLRKCKHPACEAPYFVARHLRQTYCSPKCVKWSQAKFKKNWWKQNGKDWLSTRKRKPIRKPSKRTNR